MYTYINGVDDHPLNMRFVTEKDSQTRLWLVFGRPYGGHSGGAGLAFRLHGDGVRTMPKIPPTERSRGL